MGNRRGKAALALAGMLVGSLLAAGPAFGAFHLVKISEVHNGTGVNGDHDFIELQMYAPGQNFVAGSYMRTYDSTGTEFSTFEFPTNVGSGQNQRTILISQGTTAIGGRVPDFVNSGLSVPSEGAACFLEDIGSPDLGTADTGIDCVAFGFFGGGLGHWGDGEPSPVGNEVTGTGISGQLGDSESIHRSIAPRCRTALDAVDDTDDSATDFRVGPPSPRSNATAPSERVCVPCGPSLSTVTGTNGRNVLFGTPGRDFIAGKGGNDRLVGRGGNDVLCGGAGRDRLEGRAGRDRLLGGAAADLLLGGRGRDFLLGQGGPDVLRGGGGPDVLRGGPGRDRQTQ